MLVIEDPVFDNVPVDMDLATLLGKPPKMTRDVAHVTRASACVLDSTGIEMLDAAKRVLQFPAVADKTFLISIGDRTVGGLCSRDPMVGPWQVPVRDVAVTPRTSTDTRRGDGDGRAIASGVDQCAGVGTHGGR